MSETPAPTRQLDTRGTYCPRPVIDTDAAMRQLGAGEVLEVLADDVGAGSDATCTRDGTAVWCWGANNSGQVGIGTPSDPANHDGCINYCKLKPKQVVTAFPANTPLANVQQLDVGYLHVCARLGDNSLWCWGSGGSNVAAQQLIQGNPINDNALWSTCSSSGLPTSLRRLSRDNVLRNPITVVPQMCP